MKLTRSLLVLALSLSLLGCKTVPAPTYSYGGAGGDLLAGAALSVLALTIYPFLPLYKDPPNGTDSEIREIAVTDAQADLAHGRPGVCDTRMRGSSPTGILPEQRHAVVKLRRILISTREPYVITPYGFDFKKIPKRVPSPAEIYTEAYNKTIIGHLTGASYE